MAKIGVRLPAAALLGWVLVHSVALQATRARFDSGSVHDALSMLHRCSGRLAAKALACRASQRGFESRPEREGMSILEGWPTGKAMACYVIDGVTPEHVRFVHPPLGSRDVTRDRCPCSSMEEQRSTKPWFMQVRILSGVLANDGEATRLATGAVLKTVWAKAVGVRLPPSPQIWAASSVGQSCALLMRWSQVRILCGPLKRDGGVRSPRGSHKPEITSSNLVPATLNDVCMAFSTMG